MSRPRDSAHSNLPSHPLPGPRPPSRPRAPQTPSVNAPRISALGLHTLGALSALPASSRHPGSDPGLWTTSEFISPRKMPSQPGCWAGPGSAWLPLGDLGVPAPRPPSPPGASFRHRVSWSRPAGRSSELVERGRLPCAGRGETRLWGGSWEACSGGSSGPSPQDGGPQAEQEPPGQGPGAAPHPRPSIAQVSPTTVHVHF